jgi:hypothetical protein
MDGVLCVPTSAPGSPPLLDSIGQDVQNDRCHDRCSTQAWAPGRRSAPVPASLALKPFSHAEVPDLAWLLPVTKRSCWARLFHLLCVAFVVDAQLWASLSRLLTTKTGIHLSDLSDLLSDLRTIGIALVGDQASLHLRRCSHWHFLSKGAYTRVDFSTVQSSFYHSALPEYGSELC